VSGREELKPLHVLLVEDNPDHADLVGRMLDTIDRPRTFVTHADCLAKAIDALKVRPFDVVLLDMKLPDSDGMRSVEAVLRMRPRTALIVLTSIDDDERATKAVGRGAQDYLVKDQLDARQLAHAIRYATARKAAERERLRRRRLQGERNRLKEAMTAMDKVLGVIGHELRTPLASLRAMAEFLLAGSHTFSVDQHRFLTGIRNETVRMAETVNNLLEAARLDSGVARWTWDTFRVADACQSALDTLRIIVDEKRVALVCDVQPIDLTMRGDADAVRRVVLNLLTNAHKHTPEGLIHLTARAEREGGADWVVLSVQDSGAGISPQMIDKLGKAFALNAGAVGDGRGAGLGLAICRGVAAAHGGDIQVWSAPGEGSAFTVRLRADLPGPAAGDAGITFTQRRAAG
jgi:signal transduction histidine kinase